MTVKQAVQQYPFFTYSGLQWYLFHRETNGLSKAVIKMGKKVLIDSVAFEEWIESKREA